MVVAKVRLGSKEKAAKYWRTQSYQARLAALSKFGWNITNGRKMLNQDFKEFIQSLNNHGVRYLVVGGYAVALHGYPRYTKDIDIWVEPSSENAAKIIQVAENRTSLILKTWSKPTQA